jgi:HD-GYP domain-containing protein (c-di-GMP phosphodiesterase class II)
LTAEEYEAVQQHVAKGVEMLHPVGGSLRRIIPIILAHHDKFDGSGYNPTQGDNIPLEARIIAVADVYDALTSDRPYRKAMSTYDARDVIVKGAGTEFDPVVVDAFVAIFRTGDLELWSAPLSAASHFPFRVAGGGDHPATAGNFEWSLPNFMSFFRWQSDRSAR